MAEYTTEVSNLYEKNRATSLFYRLERQMFDDFLGDVSGKSVLDLGCGAGTRVLTLMDKGAASGFGVEYSQNMLDIAIARSKERSNVTFQQGDLVTLPYLGKQFDCVLSEFVLCYAQNVDDLRSMLANCFKHVKSGGVFVATTSDPWRGANYLEHNAQFKRQYGVSYRGYDGTLEEGQAVTVEFTPPSTSESEEEQAAAATAKTDETEHKVAQDLKCPMDCQLVGDTCVRIDNAAATATNYWYSPEHYLQLLAEVGFVNARIYRPTACPDALKDVADGLKDYLAEPDCFFILASAP